MTNNENNACVLEAKDTLLPWGPFVLPILLTAPWICGIGLVSLVKICSGDMDTSDPTLILIAGYFFAGVSLWSRQEWALWLLAVITGVWVAQTSQFLWKANWDPKQPGLVMLFSTFYTANGCYQALTCLVAVVGGMACRRVKRQNSLKCK